MGALRSHLAKEGGCHPASFGWQATLRLNQLTFLNGVVAQLGERELCKLEVVGSIPIDSTNLRSRSGAKVALRELRLADAS